MQQFGALQMSRCAQQLLSSAIVLTEIWKQSQGRSHVEHDLDSTWEATDSSVFGRSSCAKENAWARMHMDNLHSRRVST